MHGDIERETLVGPRHEVRNEDQVTGARYRQEFRQALENRQDYNVKAIHRQGYPYARPRCSAGIASDRFFCKANTLNFSPIS